MSITQTVPPPAPARLGVRRLPARRADPPYDDEVGGTGTGSTAPVGLPASVGDAVVQGALALAFAVGSAGPLPRRVPPARPVLHLVPPWQPSPGREAAAAGPGTVRTELSCPASWSGRFSQALVEVLAGDRPVAQLLRWTSTEVYADLQRRVLLTVAPTAGQRRPGSGAAAVRRVHVDEPGTGVAEVAAVVRSGPRCRALALRLEGVNGRWVCTALELG